MEQKPTLGRIVIYRTTAQDRERAINGYMFGCQANSVYELPAVIVNVFSDTCINVKVINDGVQDYWKTSILQGEGEGQWRWPSRQ